MRKPFKKIYQKTLSKDLEANIYFLMHIVSVQFLEVPFMAALKKIIGH